MFNKFIPCRPEVVLGEDRLRRVLVCVFNRRTSSGVRGSAEHRRYEEAAGVVADRSKFHLWIDALQFQRRVPLRRSLE